MGGCRWSKAKGAHPDVRITCYMCIVNIKHVYLRISDSHSGVVEIQVVWHVTTCRSAGSYRHFLFDWRPLNIKAPGAFETCKTTLPTRLEYLNLFSDCRTFYYPHTRVLTVSNLTAESNFPDKFVKKNFNIYAYSCVSYCKEINKQMEHRTQV